jgi:hypothetical protein
LTRAQRRGAIVGGVLIALLSVMVVAGCHLPAAVAWVMTAVEVSWAVGHRVARHMIR